MSRHVQFAQYSMGQGHTFGDRAIASVPFEIQETQSPKFLGVQGHHYEGSDPHPTSSTEGCKRVQGGSLGCIPRHAEMLRFGHPTLEELIARLNARIGKGNASLNPGSYPPSFKKGVLTDKVVADVLNNWEEHEVYGRNATQRGYRRQYHIRLIPIGWFDEKWQDETDIEARSARLITENVSLEATQAPWAPNKAYLDELRKLPPEIPRPAEAEKLKKAIFSKIVRTSKKVANMVDTDKEKAGRVLTCIKVLMDGTDEDIQNANTELQGAAIARFLIR
ncbi:hypothetical protein BGX21_002280 [Mortierella sp. AD011]|nr:hypothetical protein BGX21_002280 [Mortierella sp. AD011]